MSANNFTKQKQLIFKTGNKIKLINKVEYCKSIIADGKELIKGSESGELIVPELKDEKVYITFKDDVTSFSFAFWNCTSLKSIPANLFAHNPNVTTFAGTFKGCTGLTSIPENLFANNPEVTNFWSVFNNCTSLQSIPENLFANNKKVTNFSYAFKGCTGLKSIPADFFANCPKVTDFIGIFVNCTSLQSLPTGLFDNNRKVINFTGTFWGSTGLTGESPYTMVDGKKVHLYERKNYPGHFTEPTSFSSTFRNCTGLTDYAQIASGWK